jgi:hypothetical protein
MAKRNPALFIPVKAGESYFLEGLPTCSQGAPEYCWDQLYYGQDS